MFTAVPYTAPRSKRDPLRRAWGRMVSDHCGGSEAEFDKLMTARNLDNSGMRKRIQANQMLMLCEATGFQASCVLESLAPNFNMTPRSMRAAIEASASEAAVPSGDNVVSDITNFITQMLHMSLDVFPRLLANELLSIQPLTQPNGYVFFLSSVDDTGRKLSDLDLFNKDYTQDPGEGQQIRKVKSTLTKQLVEAEYRKLMWESSHEVMVALRTQHNLSIESLNDGIVARELTWEVDRVLIDRLWDFADNDYFFDVTAKGTYDSKTEVDKKAYDETFLSKFYAKIETDMQRKIFVKPNWMIAGSEVVAFLKRLRKYEARKEGDLGDTVMTNGSVQFAGRMDDLKVWIDPQLGADDFLVGHTDNMDPFYAGAIYSPFGFASMMTAAWTDPNNLLTRKARALAFAFFGVRSSQYARGHLKPAS